MFEDSAKQFCPIKIKKFIVDKNEGSRDLLMSDLVGLELLTPEAVNFEKNDLVPSNLNLSMLSSISPQLISAKAKLIGLQDSQIVTTPKFSLNKAEGNLVDEHGTAKITFWGDDTEKVESGKTYYFTNLRLKINKINGELYVNPAKGNSNITEAEPFEKILNIPEEIPAELTSTTVELEIIGIADVKVDHCFVKCNRIVPTRSITKCENPKYKLVQKHQKCKKKRKAFVKLRDSSSI